MAREAARPDTWMPWHIGKYLGDTMHLTTEQHGAYLLLLAAGWMRHGQIPDDDEQLASIARLPLERWRTMRVVVAAFFTIKGGAWRQKRQIAELEKAIAITKARSEAGQKGGRPKATGKQIESPALTNEKQNESPGSVLLKPGRTPLPKQKEEESNPESSSLLPRASEVAEEPPPQQRTSEVDRIVKDSIRHLSRASRAPGPNLADPAVRKAVHESKVFDFIRTTKPPAQFEAIMLAYLENPDAGPGKAAFERASKAMGRRPGGQGKRSMNGVAAPP